MEPRVKITIEQKHLGQRRTMDIWIDPDDQGLFDSFFSLAVLTKAKEEARKLLADSIAQFITKTIDL